MKAAGCGSHIDAPLTPQYSGATTASVHDAVFDRADCRDALATGDPAAAAYQ